MKKEINEAKTLEIVGIWRDDPQKVMQAYEFDSWAAALDFCRRNRKDFSLRYHPPRLYCLSCTVYLATSPGLAAADLGDRRNYDIVQH